MIHNLYLVCMVRMTYLYIDTIFVFQRYIDLFSGCFWVFCCCFFYLSSLHSWMLEHGCLDTCAVLGIFYACVSCSSICTCSV